jgi:uncharacterized protein YdaU (DUF1376 family)
MLDEFSTLYTPRDVHWTDSRKIKEIHMSKGKDAKKAVKKKPEKSMKEKKKDKAEKKKGKAGFLE